MRRLYLGAFAVLAVLAIAQVRSQNRAKAASSDVGIEFVKIQPGEFTMGCSDSDADCKDDEKPAHHIKITKAFEMGKYEITQAQWMAAMGSNPSTIKGDNRPVETVGRNEALDFLNKLNARNDGYKYRLPSEAEWEYAARAGAKDKGPLSLDAVAWYGDNSDDETHPVGQKKPNAWGLYDMLGNVREWVADNYQRNYYSNSPDTDPTGPALGVGGRGGPGGRGGRGGGKGGFKGGPKGGPGGGKGKGGMRELPVIRGGAWDNPAGLVRVSARYNYYGPTLRVSDLGFRAARELVQNSTTN